jgi:hypothetical protein
MQLLTADKADIPKNTELAKKSYMTFLNAAQTDLKEVTSCKAVLTRIIRQAA